MENIKKILNNDKYAAYSGIELLEIAPGQAKAKMAVKDIHLNGIGTVQGGAIFTLADFCFAAASNSHGQVAVALNVNISFTKAVSSGTLFAEAVEISKSTKIATYTVKVTNEKSELIALFQGMAYRK